ncbi:phosphate metabolism protein 7, partial [Coemansia nantahalensis]
MFLRSLQSGALQFALFAVIGLPILLPVDATYENTSATELERLTMSSVANSYGRMWAHVGVFAACSFIAVGLIFRDLQHFVAIRARYMRESLAGAASFKASAVMVTGLSCFGDDKAALQDVFGGQPGGIRGIYPCIDHKDIVDAVAERDEHRFNGLAQHDVDWRGIGFKKGPTRLYASLLRAAIVVIIILWIVP